MAPAACEMTGIGGGEESRASERAGRQQCGGRAKAAPNEKANRLKGLNCLVSHSCVKAGCDNNVDEKEAG